MGFTAEGSSITLTSKEDSRLYRLANGDPDDEDVGDDEDQTPEDQRAARESEREVSLPRFISNSWGTNSLNMNIATTPSSTPHSNRV